MDENKELKEQEMNGEENEAPEIDETAEETAETVEETAEETAEETEDEDEEEDSEEEEDAKDGKSILRDVCDVLESTFITVFVIVLVFTYFLHPVNIVGHSMVPTLNKNYDSSNRRETDKIFMTTVYTGIRYGDILVIDKDVNYLLDDNGEPYQPSRLEAAPIDECIIKRVIAVGGQTVDLRDGKVYVDGDELDEPYILKGSTTNDLGAFTGQYPLTVPEGYFFVMGDNRNGSTDSRASSVGLVKKDQIYGKAIVKYSPLSEFDILIGSHKESKND